jgi:hypothetical protein
MSVKHFELDQINFYQFELIGDNLDEISRYL